MGAIEQYPYIRGERGFRLQNMLENPARGKGYFTESGGFLLYTVKSRQIEIEDFNIPWYRLCAHVSLDHSLWFDLRTERDKKKHPDLYAGRFVDAALEFFSLNGVTIKKFLAEWNTWSINYQKFMEEYEKNPDPLAAAYKTWSVQTMSRHGFYFESPDDINIQRGFITATMKTLTLSG
jgi:hypothetical protein